MTNRLLACVIGATLMAVSPPGLADTPTDTLVMAWQVDDIVTLDPAEIFEFSGAEYGAQVYDRLVTYEIGDVSEILPDVAESWEVSDDGRVFTFKIRDDIVFHSGNPLTAADAAYSLQRVVKLDKAPAFILTQFGFTPENVDEKIRATDAATLVIETDQAYAPTFLLQCLAVGVGSMVDSRLVQENEVDGDMGHEWLKDHSAGSGPFILNAWRPGESLVLDRFDAYWRGMPGLAQIFIRHVPDAETRRLMLENGDADIARDLPPDQLVALSGKEGFRQVESRKGALYYLALNTRREPFQKIEVRQALKYLIDYQGMQDTILTGSAVIHQSFLPKGFLGAIDDTPFTLDVEKARELLAQAGYPDGFSITMDTRNTATITDMALSIQDTFAEAGIDLEIVPGDGSATLGIYRARDHDIYIGRWGPDYHDPHANADTFARNPDNSDDAQSKSLAWRNAWEIPAMTRAVDAAVLEHDPRARAQVYEDLQREHMEVSPFVFMFQDIEVIVEARHVQELIWGASFDDNRYWKATKIE